MYCTLLGEAFAVDYGQALDGSVKLALWLGVSEEVLLKNTAEVDDYFLK